jgi:small nuclear ribonucleoprotein G
MDKKLFVQLNGSRQIIGVLRGYDVFLNIVLDEAVEKKPNGDHVKVGTTVIRGNSVVLMEVRTSFKKINEALIILFVAILQHINSLFYIYRLWKEFRDSRLFSCIQLSF